jgi:hypothetical protein
MRNLPEGEPRIPASRTSDNQARSSAASMLEHGARAPATGTASMALGVKLRSVRVSGTSEHRAGVAIRHAGVAYRRRTWAYSSLFLSSPSSQVC